MPKGVEHDRRPPLCGPHRRAHLRDAERRCGADKGTSLKNLSVILPPRKSLSVMSPYHLPIKDAPKLRRCHALPCGIDLRAGPTMPTDGEPLESHSGDVLRTERPVL